MKKFIRFFLFVGFCSLGFSTFAATTPQTFLESITQEKSSIETMFDTSYSSVYKQFQTSIGSFLTSLNYQGLVCLGVINDSLLLQQMQNDSRNLKVGFLNAYTTLYADALDIEQKQRIYKDTAVSLFQNGATYETEKTRVLTSVLQLSTNQKKLIEQFQQSYDSKIKKFVTDYYDYSEKNKDLLATIAVRIKTIQQVDQQYKQLTLDLASYQTRFAGTGATFFSKLYFVKQASLSGLDVSLQNIIAKEVKRYRILPALAAELGQQKEYALGLFTLQMDEKINLLLAQWYDNKEFTQITKEVTDFVSTYSSGSKTQCSSLMSSATFLQDSSRLLTKIAAFSKTFSSQGAVSSSSGFQQKITKWFPVVTQLQKEITTTFTTAITQKEQVLLDEYKKQTGGTTPVVTTEPDASSVIIVPSSFQFTQAFKKNQSHADIKILQQLLTTLGYYKGSIDGIYSSPTLESVYQYQLAKGLLKGYEKRPQTWGWMGPSTRAQLNKDLLK